MAERPILFGAPMVRAILAGTKTQTRRVITGHPGGDWHNDGLGRITSKHPKQGRFGLFVRRGLNSDFPECDIVPCPYGQPGDLLWVRETWAVPHRFDHLGPSNIPTDGVRVHYAASEERGGLLWRPSIHMCRWASRITLRITSVRVERLQDISDSDAIAEGIAQHPDGPWHAYRSLWSLINGPESWDANPWVWVVEFGRTGSAA